MAQEFQNYYKSLLGRTVENWQGWVLGVSESEYGNVNSNYTLSLRMEPPKDGRESLGGVLLEDVPRKQVQDLNFSPSVEQLTPEASGQYRLLKFSGTIAGLLDNGQIMMENVNVSEP